MANVFFIQRF